LCIDSTCLMSLNNTIKVDCVVQDWRSQQCWHKLKSCGM